MSISLSKARAGFALANKVEGKSPRTTEWYDQMVGRFILWLEAERGGDSAELATRDAIRTYIHYLQTERPRFDGHHYKKDDADLRLSPRSVRGHFQALRSFFNWMVREELLPDSPMCNMQKPRCPKYVEPVYTQDEVAALLKACDNYPKPLAIRNRALLLFMVDTGARAGEVTGLRAEDVDIEHGRCLVTGKGA